MEKIKPKGIMVDMSKDDAMMILEALLYIAKHRDMPDERKDKVFNMATEMLYIADVKFADVFERLHHGDSKEQ